MKKIIIPTIYEENILEFVFEGFRVKFRYQSENAVISLVFHSVYQFDFCEFDYINETDWEFGLTQYKQSPLLEALYAGVPSEIRSGAFGGEPNQLSHYKLVIDDVGIYNIICKDFSIEGLSQMPTE